MAQKKLKDSEKQDLMEIFKQFDQDGSGEISANELNVVMNAIGMNPTEAEIQTMLKEADTDNDGQLNFEEFAALVAKRSITVDEKESLRDAFRTLDKDNSGYLDEEELKALLPNENIDEVIKAFDRDGDGKIDYEEFVAMLTGC